MPFRNIETHFSKAPQVAVQRSRFKYNKPVKFTFNAGDLVPFMVEEVLPGDTFNLKTSKVVRLSTPLKPTMDNLYLDTYYFFVPYRLIWDNWQAFMGESDKAWTQSVVHVPPKLRLGGNDSSYQGSYQFGFVEPQSLLNYLFAPVFTNNSKKALEVTAFDVNAYIKIWNDWFRSENLCDEVPIYTGDGLIPFAYLTSYVSYLQNNFGFNGGLPVNGSCLPVAKFADYFTRALPQPQKGADVLIPSSGNVVLDLDNYDKNAAPSFIDPGNPTTFKTGALYQTANVTTGGTNTPGISNDPNDSQQFPYVYDPANTLSLNGLEITVNNLRLAMQTQKLLERDARGGTRYVEIIKSHFGVTSPDARLQRSEYLGGKRTLLNMTEVIQTSESTGGDPLGTLGGRSLTNDKEDSFIKSFVEHGLIIGVCCVRPDRTYAQGLPRRLFRFNRLDHYFPVLANIGEQPILNREIYMTDISENNINSDDVFGYQEAWAEYRTQQGRLVGYMQPGITSSLASWNYGDNYQSTPILSSEWLYQGKNEIDRTLAITSATAPQFIADFLIYGTATRPMPVFSIPGLVDHN